MKVLIVCSGTRGIVSPFITEQVESLSNSGKTEFCVFQIKRGGWSGYIKQINPLSKTIKKFEPDLIHAHYGLSGLLANYQRTIPVITTFHGSDVNISSVLKWSKLAHRFSAASIFVESSMMDRFRRHHRSFLIPCGINLSTFYQMDKTEAGKELHVQQESINILFSSGFDNPNKNYPLARTACNIVEKKTGRKVNLLELKGLTRREVSLHLNAADCALLYSSSEGSPQFIKEAMACNCPIVTTNVGDVSWVIGSTGGCFITSPDSEDVSDKLISAIQFAGLSGRTNGRERIISLHLDSESVAQKILDVYTKILKQ